MKRFIYTPHVEAMIQSNESGDVFDITNDIISGSVTRITNAVSSATLELQNKNAKYTRLFKPMDKIVIWLTRTTRVLVFTGYLDEAPLFQLYPAPVTIQASCSLKLLQNTYFDPGLPFLMTYFARYGWAWDPVSGTLNDAQGKFGNPTSGGIADVMMNVIRDVGGWPEKHINILGLPLSFVQNMAVLQKSIAAAEQKDFDHARDRITRLLGIDSISSDINFQDSAANTKDTKTTYRNVRATAYGPPWDGDNAMQGDGVTADGTDIRDGHQEFIVAADRKLFPIGTMMKVWPNPFGEPDQVFRVADTGGAIDGKHIDFYIGFPGGRKAQIAWGSRLVTVTIVVSSESSGRSASDSPNRAAQATKTWVRIAPNADASVNGSALHMHAETIDFVAKIGQIYGAPLLIGTGTNHTHLGSASDHFEGWAADITQAGGQKTIGSVLTRLGQAALLAAGMSAVEAKRSLGNIYEVNGYQIIFNFDSDQAGNHYDHLHVGLHDRKKIAASGGNAGSTSANINDITGNDPAIDDASALARQAAYFVLQLQGSDIATSNSLMGKRALANDIPLFEWVQAMAQASGREFMSLPNGDFIAFFPDYFGLFERHPYWKIAEIEMIDFTIQANDRNLATHVFASGSNFGVHEISLADRMFSSVASVEEVEAFKLFIDTDSKFNAMDFLGTYGARPYPHDVPLIRHPLLIWISAWAKFIELWSEQFLAETQLTFMPELFPGGLVEISAAGHPLTMYVNEVTHTFSRESGYTTSATLKAPASVDKGAKKLFGPLVLSGAKYGVAARRAQLDIANAATTKEKPTGAGPQRTGGGPDLGHGVLSGNG